MKLIIVEIIMMAIMLMIKQCFTIIQSLKLNDSLIQPIYLLLSENQSLIYGFSNDKSYSFNPNNTYYLNNLLQSKQITNSTFITRIKGEIIGIACWDNKAIVFIDEEGGQIAKKEGITYDEDTRCFLFRKNNELFIFAYSDNVKTYLQQYIYNNVSHDFTPNLNKNEIAFAYHSTLCNILDNELFPCILYNTKAYIVYYYHNLTLAADNTLEINQIDGRPYIFINTKIKGRTLIIMLTNRVVYGYMIDFTPGNTSNTPPIDGNIALSTQHKIQLDKNDDIRSLSITSYNKLRWSNLLDLLLVIGCSDTHCYCKYYDYKLIEQLKPFSFPLIGNGMNINVQMLLNGLKLSILVTQSDSSYFVLYSYPNCTHLNSGYLYYSAPFYLKDFANEVSEKMFILFNFVGHNLVFLENSIEVVVRDKYYPFVDVYFDFNQAGNYELPYTLKDSYDQEGPVCVLSIAVCTFVCLQCYGFGNNNNPMCLSCARNYYQLFSDPSQCVNKESCISSSGFLLDLPFEVGSKCVQSCRDLNYLTDVEDSTCVTACKGTHVENKIDKECLNEDDFNKKMEYYIKNISTYVKGLYDYYPQIISEEFIMSIYNTSILPENYILEAISLGNPYEIIYASSIYPGACEEKLRKYYNLNPSLPLIIAKFDRNNSNQISNEVEYSVFSYDGMLLDHSICATQEDGITIISPIANQESSDYVLAKRYNEKEIDVFNSTELFFNDICYSFTTEFLTDIPLIDRLEDVLLDEAILCNKGCKYKSIDYEQNTVICSCYKEAVHLYKKNYDSLFASLTSFWSQSNFAVVKCSNLVFNFKNFSNNIGSWFMLFLIIIETFSAGYFFAQKIHVIEKKLLAEATSKTKNVKDIIEQFKLQKSEKIDVDSLNNKPLMITQSKTNLIIPSSLMREHNMLQVPYRNKNITLNSNLSFEDNNKNIEEVRNYPKLIANTKHNISESMDKDNMLKTSQLNLNKHSQMIESNLFEDRNLKENYSNIDNKGTSNFNIVNNPKDLLDKNKGEHNISDDERKENTLNIYEKKLNKKSKTQKVSSMRKRKALDSKEENNVVIKFNMANFIFFYSAFLRNGHPILNSFFIETLQKIRVIQISMFFFCISVSFTLNALFFSDKYVSESYKTKGGINFAFNMPKMIYSFVLINAFKLIFNLLSSIASAISKLSMKDEMNERLLIIKRLKMRLTIFYVLKIIFIAFFWYYVAAFCSVYPNIQIIWIISSLSTFMLEMIFPFCIAAALTFLLFISVKYNFKCLISFVKKFTPN